MAEVKHKETEVHNQVADVSPKEAEAPTKVAEVPLQVVENHPKTTKIAPIADPDQAHINQV